MSERADIATREDCDTLVRAFYGRALRDPVIGFIFTDVARLDLEAHLPVISSFWETILLDARSYGGGAFAPHVQLHLRVGLKPGHFERWLSLWRATVDELFARSACGPANSSSTVARQSDSQRSKWPGFSPTLRCSCTCGAKAPPP